MKSRHDLFILSLILFMISLSVSLVDGATDSEYIHIYYVRPTNETSQCPGVPCLTLMEYMQNETKYPFTNATFKFLSGSHALYFQPLIVGLVQNLALVIEDSSGVDNTIINCTVGAHLLFKGTQNVTIDGLRFNSCGTPRKTCTFRPDPVDYTLGGSLQFDHVINLTLSNITIENSFEVGICAFNVMGIIRIIGGRFLYNKVLIPFTLVAPHVSVAYSIPPELNIAPGNSTLTIENTTFNHGAGGALCLHFVQIYPVNVSIHNVSTVGFSDSPSLSPYEGRPDVGIEIACDTYSGYSGESSVQISGSLISGHLGGGLRLIGTVFLRVVVQDTILRGNTAVIENGAALTVLTAGYSKCSPRSDQLYDLTIIIDKNTARPTANGWIDWQPIFLVSVMFENNSYISTDGAIATPIVSISTHQNVSFINCIFTNNIGSVVLAYASNVIFVNNTFRSNYGTPILAESSNFTLSGDIQFIENLAFEGGGLAFYANSYMLLSSNTNILFASNFATDVGGGIYVDSSDSKVIVLPDWQSATYTICFMQPLIDSVNISLTFMNNTSVNGGDNVYGGFLYPCLMLGFYHDPVDVINIYFHFDSSNTTISSMASDPLRACLCRNGKPDCLIIFSEEEHKVYPGQTFTLSAVLVGERFGSVSGAISAQLYKLNEHSPPSLQHLQNSQTTGARECTKLEYTVFSSNDQELLVFTTTDIPLKGIPDRKQVANEINNYNITGQISLQLLSYPVFNNITLLHCPLGFVLSGEPGGCVCDSQLSKNNIKCNLSDQTIQRSGSLWVNASYNGNVSDGVIICKYCPFAYCKPEEVDVNLEIPDRQCDLNHSGIACGSCQTNLSLMIGSSRCKSCSNKYLVLLIPFAIAGFALVFLIKVLNLTVSVGTINGLVFYANIVGADNSIFFQVNKSNPFTNTLMVFIAWLNLDLGIETCFFDGLKAYWKAWLQFVFPLYLWAIIGFVIILSRVSALARKIFGNNSPSVLATLFLLSYAKLLRTIIIALSFTLLDMPDDSHVVVWSFDGSVPYLKGKHIALFVVALLVLLLLWLPFTVILLFWQLLQRLSDYSIVRLIVVKQMPFFDTYFGPLKGEHRYWVGVLLLARGILLTVFAITPSNATKVDLLSISVVSAVLLVYLAILPHVKQQKGDRRGFANIQGVSLIKKIKEKLHTFTGSCYTVWYMSLLETSFILNLLVLSSATLYVYSSDANEAEVVNTFVGIAFVQFVGIVCFHGYASLRKCSRMNKVVAGVEVQNGDNINQERAGPTDSSEYREPLLEPDEN